MAADDDEHQEENGATVSATGLLEPIQYSILKQKKQSVMEYFQWQWDMTKFLDQPIFHSFRRMYSGISIHANPHLSSPDSQCMQRFDKALTGLQDGDVLQVAFHGTSANNVASILQNCLDPALRLHQAYGPGDYFSLDPLIAATYSSSNRSYWVSDGKTIYTCIIICVVIQPTRPARQHVVINEPYHHIPIGILLGAKTPYCFKIINENQRHLLARRYSNFHKRVQRCELVEEQIDMVKRQILLDLQNKEPVMASDLYRRFADLLKGATPECKAEILHGVLEFPEPVFATHFPGLLTIKESQMDSPVMLLREDTGRRQIAREQMATKISSQEQAPNYTNGKYLEDIRRSLRERRKKQSFTAGI